jgi:26S proteasome regulatory subunit T1
MRTLSLVRRLSHSSVGRQNRLDAERLVEHFLTRPSQCLRLSTLVSFGQQVTEKSILDSVNYVLSEIPRRLATRVRSMESLPFIVGMNPFMSRILDVHTSSFYRIATYPKVTTLEQNEEFTAELEKLVDSHADDIPQMAKGYVLYCTNHSRFSIPHSLQECSRYLTPEQTSRFLDGAIRNRIAVRLIAEQHIALSRALQHPGSMKNHVGVIDLKCRPMDLIRCDTSHAVFFYPFVTKFPVVHAVRS